MPLPPFFIPHQRAIGLTVRWLVFLTVATSSVQADDFEVTSFVASGVLGTNTENLKGVISWKDKTSRPNTQSYRIERSPALTAGGWTSLQAPITLTAQGGEAELSLEGLGEKYFFRVILTSNDSPGATMVELPAGTFSMGSAAPTSQPEEAPVHPVTVSRFSLGQSEVTWGEWKAVRAWAVGHGYPLLSGTGDGKDDRHPVHSVTWVDCIRWCHAKSVMQGLEPCYNLTTFECDFTKTGYRLPTEAEWERAARWGEIGSIFSWGNEIQHSLANYHVFYKHETSSNSYGYDLSPTKNFFLGNSVSGPTPYTTPVMSFAPGLSRLYDLAGNIAEWCQDRYSASYYATSPANDPRGPATGTDRVIRGGSWRDAAISQRPVARLPIDQFSTNHSIGFRLARTR